MTTSNCDEIINAFLASYQREFDFFSEASRICQQQCERLLEDNGIRAIITSRAKRHDRLASKLDRRKAEKRYADVNEIYKDIVDLAGVRIALYFPSDQAKVDALLRSSFTFLKDPKLFPDGRYSAQSKPFAGYKATHYRISLPKKTLKDVQERYSAAQIEIQVASVLMHAWAEVEHDLVYKPITGTNVSRDEQDILNQLNGMILSGEIALELLQRAVENRLRQTGATFSNQYELASFIFNRLKEREPFDHDLIMGRADALFQLLKDADRHKADALLPFIEQLDIDLKRPISDQIIDALVEQDPSLLRSYLAIRYRSLDLSPDLAGPDGRQFEIIGRLVSAWRDVENLVASQTQSDGRPMLFRNALNRLVKAGTVNPDLAARLSAMREIRNSIVHGTSRSLSSSISYEALRDMQDAVATLEHVINRQPSKSDQGA